MQFHCNAMATPLQLSEIQESWDCNLSESQNFTRLFFHLFETVLGLSLSQLLSFEQYAGWNDFNFIFRQLHIISIFLFEKIRFYENNPA